MENIVKSGQYYAYKFYCSSFPKIDNMKKILCFSERVQKLFEIKFTHLGYILLDPDLDCHDIGKSYQYNKNGISKFLKLSIPEKMLGNQGEASSPRIFFNKKNKFSMQFDDFSLEVAYAPYVHCAYTIEIYCAYKVTRKMHTSNDFMRIVEFILELGAQIEVGFMHIYTGNMKRVIMKGGETGFCTIEEVKQAKVMLPMHDKWRDKIPDIFLYDVANKNILDNNTLNEIGSIVRQENIRANVGSNNNYSMFFLPQEEFQYRLNRFFPNKYKRKIRALLKSKNKLQII